MQYVVWARVVILFFVIWKRFNATCADSCSGTYLEELSENKRFKLVLKEINSTDVKSNERDVLFFILLEVKHNIFITEINH